MLATSYSRVFYPFSILPVFDNAGRREQAVITLSLLVTMTSSSFGHNRGWNGMASADDANKARPLAQPMTVRMLDSCFGARSCTECPRRARCALN
jgi:hypothetical protein